MSGTDEILIRALKTPDDMAAAEALQQEVWGSPDREVVPVVELISAATAGGCVAGAFEGEAMVGFVYGIWGLRDARFYHYSRMLAVTKRLRGRGLGLRLKLHQREHTLGRGVNLMRWTYDPLEGPNAALNVGKLGVVADEYIENYYGFKHDALNRGMPTDRFFVKWFLDDPGTIDRIEGRRPVPPVGVLLETGAPLLDAVAREDGFLEPAVRPLAETATGLRMEIPPDIQAVKASDLDLALRWRLAVREASHAAFDAGFRVEDFRSAEHEGRRRSVYLLRKG